MIRSTVVARRPPTGDAGRGRGWPHLGILGALCLLTSLTACSGGGDDGSPPPPVIPWSRFLHDPTNSGESTGSVGTNPGVLLAFCRLSMADSGATVPLTSASSPAIALDGTIYIGTHDGLVALQPSDAGGPDTEPCGPAPTCSAGTTCAQPLKLTWRFAGYRQAACTPTANDPQCRAGEASCSPCTPTAGDPGCVEVGPISSSPAVSIGNDIVVGSDRGAIFALHNEDGTLSCRWRYTVPGSQPVTSSPTLHVDAGDNALTAVFVGGGDGYLIALNGDGTTKWRYPPNEPFSGAITASPALSADGTVYIPAPDGFLYALDPAGRLKWRVDIGASQGNGDFLPSLGVGATLFAVGTDGRQPSAGKIFGINPDATLKWSFTAENPVLASLAFAPLNFIDRAQLTPTRTPTPPPTASGSTPTATQPQVATATPALSATVTLTATPRTVSETVVYVVDQAGILYGIRSSNGVREARLPLGAGTVRLAPALTADFYAIIGDDDGFVHVRQLDGRAPCDPSQCSVTGSLCRTAADCEIQPCTNHTCEGSHAACVSDADCQQHCNVEAACGGEIRWVDGRLSVGAAIRSSPVVDEDGKIYVTADDGFLYVFGAPAVLQPTPARTEPPTATPVVAGAP